MFFVLSFYLIELPYKFYIYLSILHKLVLPSTFTSIFEGITSFIDLIVFFMSIGAIIYLAHTRALKLNYFLPSLIIFEEVVGFIEVVLAMLFMSRYIIFLISHQPTMGLILNSVNTFFNLMFILFAIILLKVDSKNRH